MFEVHDAVVNLPGSTTASSLIVQRGLNYLDSLAQDASGDLGLQRELAAAYEKLGAVQYTPSVAHLGDLPGALQSHRKAAALREALVAADPSNPDYRRELLDSYWFIATLLGAQGDMPRELEIDPSTIARTSGIGRDGEDRLRRSIQPRGHLRICRQLVDARGR